MRATKSSRNLATLKGYDRMVDCRSLAAWRHGPSYELDFLGDCVDRSSRIGSWNRRFVGRRHDSARYRAHDDQSNCAYGMVQHYRALDYGNRVGIDACQSESLSTWSPRMGRGRSSGTSGQSLLSALCIVLCAVVIRYSTFAEPLSGNLKMFLVVGGWLNIYLMLFNLMPVPPLDGSMILSGFSNTALRFSPSQACSNLVCSLCSWRFFPPTLQIKLLITFKPRPCMRLRML